MSTPHHDETSRRDAATQAAASAAGLRAAPAGTGRRRRWGGLSGKLLILTVLFVMLSEVLIFVPSVANFRNTWLTDKLTIAGVAASVLDGLLYANGDAVIGINPATDNYHAVTRLMHLLDDVIQRYEIPTQSCVLTHVTTHLEAINRGAPVDLVFQSIAGTQAANDSFGINLSILDEAHKAALELGRGTVGQNVMYFETGQGSALSANAHHGVDQQTCETRAYAVARRFDPLLVNTVVGFIGPEYLYDGKQIIRAGLEDHFCGKLLGLPMGCDICYTNHAEADQDDMDMLLTQLGVAGINFIMGIPGSDDIMLNYQTTSFHDALYVREVLNKPPAPEFAAWLEKMGIFGKDNRLASGSTLPPPFAHLQDRL